MEKRRPTYDLDAIKAAIGSAETLAIARSAFSDALSLGFNRAGIAELVQGFQRSMFYKSMTTIPITGLGRTFITFRRMVCCSTLKFQADVVTEFRVMSFKDGCHRLRWHKRPGAKATGNDIVSMENSEARWASAAHIQRASSRRAAVHRALQVAGEGCRFARLLPNGDGESVHVGADMAAADDALRLLKEQVDGVPLPATIGRIPHKLRLSQRAAGDLFRVGARAFDKYEKYERNLVEPSGPTIQLLRLPTRTLSLPRKSVRPARSSRWRVTPDRPF